MSIIFFGTVTMRWQDFKNCILHRGKWGIRASLAASLQCPVPSPGTKLQVRGPWESRNQRLLHPQWLPPSFHWREGYLHPAVEGDWKWGGRKQGDAGLCLLHLHQLSGASSQLDGAAGAASEGKEAVCSQPLRLIRAQLHLASAAPLPSVLWAQRNSLQGKMF